MECGGPLTPASSIEAEFCASACRMAFNNRRAKRGAELYDLFMALRHDRAVATAFKVWRLLNRLAAGFRAEDVTERDGRRSWRSPAAILARRPYLAAERIGPVRRG
ncbi:transcriptional regulator [Methylobacterium mesophilicum SR1.6/6]|uniref:Transcriptional regulator n=1 Tax=Methylobacterium mesophilicum SR1.6/6 TaxID=908290 RepID=A0A6B9G1L0_9HYPH|nr:transcriptional regulator [Methylobacterium mesophilicum SR1.6/6]